MFYQRAKSLMEAELGDEIVALDADAGQCFGFNAVAASAWRLLERPLESSALQGALRDEYEVAPGQCATEVDALLQDLIAKGLVRQFA